MMRIFYITFVGLLVMLMSSGCEDMLQPKIDNSYSSEDTWRLPDKARGVLYNAYAAMGTSIDAYGNNFLDCATADALTNDYNSEIRKLANGEISPNFNPIDVWEMAYAQFKNIHLFLENGLGDGIKYSVSSDEVDEKYKRKYKGEAYFLRAWWGWQLLKVYGGKVATGEVLGYPIVLDSSQGYEALPRNTYDECVEQIVADLDTSMVYLPLTYAGADPIIGSTGLGRASGYAAMTLKSIVYLYAASDAYQDDGTTYGERKYKWERAAYVADQTIESGLGQPNYLNVAAFGGESSSMPAEFLLGLSSGNNSNLEQRNFPPYYYGSAFTNPSHSLAKCYPMANGFPIDDERSLYDPAEPFKGRDPRFYLTFYHNESAFKDSKIFTFAGGRDSYEADIRATKTGYYLRKWMVESVSMKPGYGVTSYHFYPLIRKTELWYVFVEAANQAWGPKGTGLGVKRSALEALQILRKGAGISNDEYINEVADKGVDAFDALVMNERRIEFAFENHRYFDMRRRMRVDDMSEPVLGLYMEPYATSIRYSEKYLESRNFSRKTLYNPIPYKELQKNPYLKQNIGWE